MIGSQVCVTKKCKPNFCRGSAELVHNSHTSAAVISTTVAAKIKVTSRAISSPSCSLEKKEREPATGPALGIIGFTVATSLSSISATLLNLANGLLFLRNNFLGQLGVGKCFHRILPFRHHP